MLVLLEFHLLYTYIDTLVYIGFQGSLYYNAMQDKLTAHFLSQPQLKKYTNEMGLVSARLYVDVPVWLRIIFRSRLPRLCLDPVVV